MYAALLFTSAFVILLITAYSQLKFNKSVDEYESRIQGEIQQKYVYQYDLKRALVENEELKKSIEDLKKRVDELEKERSDFNKRLEEKDGKLEEAIEFFNILAEAESEYKKGNYVKCAQLLKSRSNKDILGPEARKKYDFLLSETSFKAGLALYNEGYRLFTQKNYADAVGKFLASYDITQSDYYSDDCLYFASASYYYIGKNEKASETLDILLSRYPQSTYRNEALLLKKKIDEIRKNEKQ